MASRQYGESFVLTPFLLAQMGVVDSFSITALFWKAVQDKFQSCTETFIFAEISSYGQTSMIQRERLSQY